MWGGLQPMEHHAKDIKLKEWVKWEAVLKKKTFTLKFFSSYIGDNDHHNEETTRMKKKCCPVLDLILFSR